MDLQGLKVDLQGKFFKEESQKVTAEITIVNSPFYARHCVLALPLCLDWSTVQVAL